MKSIRKNSPSNSIFFLATLLLLPLIGCGSSEKSTAEKELPPVKAQTLTVANQEVAENYIATGSIKASLNATLASKVLGKVTAVLVQEGDAINQDQLLVTLDPRELSSSADMAAANYKSAVVGARNAITVAEIEEKTSAARLGQAQAQVGQALAALGSAKARRDLAVAGPRTQELTQARIAVTQAESTFKLAKIELDRVSRLVQEGAIAKRELDRAQNNFDLAQSQLNNSIELEKIAKEGTRSQELRASNELVAQAEGAVKQAQAAVVQARAQMLEAKVRRGEIESAQARVGEASAAMESAKVGLAYTQIQAPFSGRVVKRIVDPGAFASPGSPLLEVEGGDYRLEVSIPESLLKFAAKGSTVQVNLAALPDKNLDGKLAEIVPKGDEASHTFLVKIVFDQSSGAKSGMYGTATIKTGSHKTILIPSTATWEREGLHYVFAVSNEKVARLRIVTLGNPHGNQVEVLSGLSTGESIVVGDRKNVVDGVKLESN